MNGDKAFSDVEQLIDVAQVFYYSCHFEGSDSARYPASVEVQKSLGDTEPAYHVIVRRAWHHGAAGSAGISLRAARAAVNWHGLMPRAG